MFSDQIPGANIAFQLHMPIEKRPVKKSRGTSTTAILAGYNYSDWWADPGMQDKPAPPCPF